MFSSRRLSQGMSRGILAVGVLGAASLTWGSIERRFPVLRRYTVTVPSTRCAEAIKILHVSDLHMYPGQGFLISFLHDVARREHIDLVISTGDNLGDTDGYELAIAAHEPFFDLPGAFVFGSNDYFSPRRKSWTRYLRSDPRVADEGEEKREPDLPWAALSHRFRDAGWIDLSNRSSHLTLSTGQVVALVGVDDPHIDRDHFPDTLNEAWTGSSLRLALTHAPYQRILNKAVAAGADLILAGHTHGGQLGIPGMPPLVTNCDLPRPWAKGLHRWYADSASSMLHVSAGLGTSPFVPFRIATRPEASLITVLPGRG